MEPKPLFMWFGSCAGSVCRIAKFCGIFTIVRKPHAITPLASHQLGLSIRIFDILDLKLPQRPQLAHIAKQIQKLTGPKNVRIKTVIDPNIVAGFTILYGDSGSKLIDMSLKKQLEDITEQL